MISRDQASKIVDSCIAALFEAEDRKYEATIAELAKENASLNQTVFNTGFTHLGRHYGLDYKGMYTHDPSLHLKLISRMSEIQRFRATMDFDRSQVTDMLYRLVLTADDLQDVLNRLPVVLRELAFPDQNFIPTPGHPGPGYPIIQDPHYGAKRYEKVLAKIETYAAMRYLY